METLESELNWDEAYRKSKPLISYSILAGIGIDKVKEAVNIILEDKDLEEFQIDGQVLSRMPEKDRHDYEFPVGVQEFVFYDGFKISKEKKPLEFVPLVLTSFDSKRKFAMACKFYESIRRYLCVMKQHSSCIDEEKKEESINSEILNGDTLRRKKGDVNELIKNNTLENLKNGDIFNSMEYYVPKAIIIVSESPYFKEFSEMLISLYSKCVNGIAYPYDFYLRYITYEVPKPGRGSAVSFTGPGEEKITLESSRRNELPSVGYQYYWEVFVSKDYLTFDDNFLTTLYWFLGQVGSTVLISSSPTKLVRLAETLRTIIFPFEYDDSYMPLINESNYDYLSAPFPVLIGVVAKNKDHEVMIEQAASLKSLLVYVDRDELRVKLDMDTTVTIKEFRKEYDEEQLKSYSGMNFPSKPLKELKKKMKKTIKEGVKFSAKYPEKLPSKESKSSEKVSEENNNIVREKFVVEIRENFLHFFMSMFKNYEKYVKQKNKVEVLDDNFLESFDQKKFTKNETDKYNFFKDLFKTRAWILFLENKIYASTVEAENQIEFFDHKIKEEYVHKKKAKDGPTSEFLNNKESKQQNKIENTIGELYK